MMIDQSFCIFTPGLRTVNTRRVESYENSSGVFSPSAKYTSLSSDEEIFFAIYGGDRILTARFHNVQILSFERGIALLRPHSGALAKFQRARTGFVLTVTNDLHTTTRLCKTLLVMNSRYELQ